MASLVITSHADPSANKPAGATHFALGHDLASLGRDDTCTFQVLDPLVSRKHLQIRFDAASGRHIAGDYRSAHGVFINGKQIVIDTALNDGDTITIGNTTLMYLATEHAEASAAMAAAKKKDEWKRTTLLGRE
ncbi:MAG: FHA domain-containing protein [Phycisphaerales bacterium]|nr:FHA domain-containing protein [Phycisphaerales bacterium]